MRRRRPPATGWKNAKDPATASGRYGTEHKRLRAQWKLKVDAGLVTCWRCQRWIVPGSRWHLGHSDDGRTYMGPEHARCNLKAASAEAHKRRWHSRPQEPTCEECGQPFWSDSCTPHHITYDGVAYECRTWREESCWVDDPPPDDPDFCCHSCGVTLDGFHHSGCCVEECPVPGCHDQLLYCFHAIEDGDDAA